MGKGSNAMKCSRTCQETAGHWPGAVVRSVVRSLSPSLARSLTHQATSHLYTPGTALSTKNTVNKTDRPLCHPELTS